jgi:hypothetical protein
MAAARDRPATRDRRTRRGCFGTDPQPIRLGNRPRLRVRHISIARRYACGVLVSGRRALTHGCPGHLRARGIARLFYKIASPGVIPRAPNAGQSLEPRTSLGTAISSPLRPRLRGERVRERWVAPPERGRARATQARSGRPPPHPDPLHPQGWRGRRHARPSYRRVWLSSDRPGSGRLRLRDLVQSLIFVLAAGQTNVASSHIVLETRVRERSLVGLSPAELISEGPGDGVMDAGSLDGAILPAGFVA